MSKQFENKWQVQTGLERSVLLRAQALVSPQNEVRHSPTSLSVRPQTIPLITFKRHWNLHMGKASSFVIT